MGASVWVSTLSIKIQGRSLCVLTALQLALGWALLVSANFARLKTADDLLGALATLRARGSDSTLASKCHVLNGHRRVT
jgi:hypothetical protein